MTGSNPRALSSPSFPPLTLSEGGREEVLAGACAAWGAGILLISLHAGHFSVLLSLKRPFPCFVVPPDGGGATPLQFSPAQCMPKCTALALHSLLVLPHLPPVGKLY